MDTLPSGHAAARPRAGKRLGLADETRVREGESGDEMGVVRVDEPDGGGVGGDGGHGAGEDGADGLTFEELTRFPSVSCKTTQVPMAVTVLLAQIPNFNSVCLGII